MEEKHGKHFSGVTNESPDRSKRGKHYKPAMEQLLDSYKTAVFDPEYIRRVFGGEENNSNIIDIEPINSSRGKSSII